VRARSTRRGAGRALAFVVQKHDATRLHYDLRLELGGVLRSWAVARGPSLDPADRRLAVEVEDHPLEYGGFEGVIAEGYGAGTVMLWDRGTWAPVGTDDPEDALAAGKLTFRVAAERLSGGWNLVRLRPRGRETRTNWLLIKESDAAARPGDGDALLAAATTSVASGRTMEEIAAGRPAARRATTPQPTRRAATKAVPKAGRSGGAAATRQAAPPLVGYVAPMLCTLVDRAPEGPGWMHEVKLDGYRMQARVRGGKARLLTRNGHDWTARFPETASALSRLPDCVLDGELFAADAHGNPDFAALQAAMERGSTGALRYFAFDLLGRGAAAEDLRARPLLDRKAALKRLLVKAPAQVVYVEHFAAAGEAVLRSACRVGLEGVVSKRADAPYRSGRGADWVKAKCRGSDEFVVGGYGAGAKGSLTLLLGARREGRLVYLGRVGSGIGPAKEPGLKRRLEPLRRADPPFAKVPSDAERRGATWVEPRLVAEIDYAGWTADGLLRQAAFKGLREDKPAEEVGVPKAGAAQPDPAEPTPVGSGLHGAATVVAGVALSNPDKPLWPEDGVTKRGLAEYLVAAAPRLLPHLLGRPLSLVRALVPGCETSFAASAMARAAATSAGPARPCGLGLVSFRRALRRSATTWSGVLPPRTRWRRAL
jgi:bifunctional non-homologous end joining protein LigD